MTKIQKFAEQYSSLQAIIEKNSVVNNRSLFEVFVDNLRFPVQMERLKMNLHTLESPKSIKTKFSEYI